jgi:hypothetical protein
MNAEFNLRSKMRDRVTLMSEIINFPTIRVRVDLLGNSSKLSNNSTLTLIYLRGNVGVYFAGEGISLTVYSTPPKRAATMLYIHALSIPAR